MVSQKNQRKALKLYIAKLMKNALPLEFELVWIPKIYQFQTEEEKVIKDAIEQNGEGLTKADAYIVSKLAKRIAKGGHICQEEAEDLKTRLPKYYKQYAAQMSWIPKEVQQ